MPGKRTGRARALPDDAVKSERFIDAAKALRVNESEEAFNKAMRALLKLKPKRGGNYPLTFSTPTR